MFDKEAGRCKECGQQLCETPWGTTVGHLPNCSKNPNK